MADDIPTLRRILRSVYAVGVDRWDAPSDVDMAQHNAIALETARQGIVLLKNDGVLPLTSMGAAERAPRIAVIGGWAHLGRLIVLVRSLTERASVL